MYVQMTIQCDSFGGSFLKLHYTVFALVCGIELLVFSGSSGPFVVVLST